VSVLPWTAVETQHGPQAVFTLSKGEEVLSSNGAWRVLIGEEQEQYDGTVVLVGTQAGMTLQLTEMHRIPTIPKRGFEHWKHETILAKLKEQCRDWKDSGSAARELQVGDRILLVRPNEYPNLGKLMVDQIRMISHQTYKGPVYNLDVDFDHGFAANWTAAFSLERELEDGCEV